MHNLSQAYTDVNLSNRTCKPDADVAKAWVMGWKVRRIINSAKLVNMRDQVKEVETLHYKHDSSFQVEFRSVLHQR